MGFWNWIVDNAEKVGEYFREGVEILEDIGRGGEGGTDPDPGAGTPELVTATISPELGVGFGIALGPNHPFNDLQEAPSWWQKVKDVSGRELVGGVSVGAAVGGVLGGTALAALAVSARR